MAENIPVPSKRRRAVHLALLSALAFGPYVFVSLLYVLADARGVSDAAAASTPRDAATLNMIFLFTLLFDALVLGVFVFIVRRQGRRLREFGIDFHWWDVPLAALIFCFVYASMFIWYAVSEIAYTLFAGNLFETAPRNIEHFSPGLTLGAVVFVLVNPFYEELLVRAYLMTEVEALTGKAWVAVAASVLVQLSYHLYQGPGAVWMLVPAFALFSVFYAVWKRITPLILAHLYFDLLPLLYYLEQR